MRERGARRKNHVICAREEIVCVPLNGTLGGCITFRILNKICFRWIAVFRNSELIIILLAMILVMGPSSISSWTSATAVGTRGTSGEVVRNGLGI